MGKAQHPTNRPPGDQISFKAQLKNRCSATPAKSGMRGIGPHLDILGRVMELDQTLDDGGQGKTKSGNSGHVVSVAESVFENEHFWADGQESMVSQDQATSRGDSAPSNSRSLCYCRSKANHYFFHVGQPNNIATSIELSDHAGLHDFFESPPHHLVKSNSSESLKLEEGFLSGSSTNSPGQMSEWPLLQNLTWP